MQGDLFFFELVRDASGLEHVVIGNIVEEFLQWWLLGVGPTDHDRSHRSHQVGRGLAGSSICYWHM